MPVDAVFLDRDGVINVDSGYVGDWDSFVFLPGVIEAMRTLCERVGRTEPAPSAYAEVPAASRECIFLEALDFFATREL